MSKEEIDGVMESFESSKKELEKKIQSTGKTEPLEEKKIRKGSHRLVLKAIQKQIDRMNAEINEGNITTAQMRKTFIESLISMLKED
jgi:hypothetical protein